MFRVHNRSSAGHILPTFNWLTDLCRAGWEKVWIGLEVFCQSQTNQSELWMQQGLAFPFGAGSKWAKDHFDGFLLDVS